MAEYIKREALVDLVLGKLRFMGDARIMNKGDKKVLSEIDGYEKAIYAVHELLLDKDLIEDIQPVKRGKWDFQGYQLFKCTNCKEMFTQNQLEAMQNHIDSEEWTFPNFCPNCGADMREPEPIKG